MEALVDELKAMHDRINNIQERIINHLATVRTTSNDSKPSTTTPSEDVDIQRIKPAKSSPLKKEKTKKRRLIEMDSATLQLLLNDVDTKRATKKKTTPP